MITPSLGEKIRKAIESDIALYQLIEEITKTSPARFVLTEDCATRVLLEKLYTELQEPSIPGLTKLLVHVEYLIARKLIVAEPAEILSNLLKELLRKARENTLDKNMMERAKLILEAVYTMVLKAKKR